MMILRYLYTWNWNHLNPATSGDFKWVYSTTPLSDLSVIYFSWLVYFVAIVAIRWHMAERNRIDRSHQALAFYNCSMIICSTYIWLTASYPLWQIVKSDQQGRTFTFCYANQYTNFEEYGGHLYYAMYISYLVRYYAYLDTVILAIRKKSIPFLHWYQHMFVILMMWSWLQDQSIFGNLATAIISFVQIFRYLHFFLHCIDKEIGWVKTTALVLQVVQFIAAMVITAFQMRVCPQSNCVLLSASINVTMVYIILKYYDPNGDTTATTREHYKRRNSNKKEVLELSSLYSNNK